MRRSRAFVIRRNVYANHIGDSKSVSRLTSTPTTASAATPRQHIVVGIIFHAENRYKHRLTLAHGTRAPIRREWELIHLPEVTAYGFAHFAKINKLNVSCGWSKFYGLAWHGMAWIGINSDSELLIDRGEEKKSIDVIAFGVPVCVCMDNRNNSDGASDIPPFVVRFYAFHSKTL